MNDAPPPPSPLPPPEPVSVVLPIQNLSADTPTAIRAWHKALELAGGDYELLLVDDGTAADLDGLAVELPNTRVLPHDTPRGYGACVRTAVAEARHPLVLLTALDYPYAPADLPRLRDRIAHTDEVFGRPLDVVSGCRTGRTAPAGVRLAGRLVRGFARVALGLPLEPAPGWLGAREFVRGWLAWGLFGAPFHDPNCALKLFRRAVFGRFPIQCDGDFVHVELAAKATFTTCLMDEVPLSPSPAAIPFVRWGEAGKLFRDARFTQPTVTN